MTKGFTQIGVQFQDVGADDQSTTLKGMKFSGLNGFDWDMFQGGDSLTIWDESSQTYAVSYTWSGDGNEMFGVPANVWFDEGSLSEVDIPLVAGTSLFVKTDVSSGATATTSGEVVANDSVTIELSAGFSQLANPFPVAIDLNDAKFSGLTGFDWDTFTGGDSVTIWDPVSQTYAVSYTWSGAGFEMFGVPANVWFDEGTLAQAEVSIPLGGTFFIRSTSKASVTFSNPKSSTSN